MKTIKFINELSQFRIKIMTFFVLVMSMVSMSQAETLSYLGQGRQVFFKMLDMIDEAETSIDLSYFIFRPCDASTQVLVDHLEKKAKAGVQVRILLDGWPNVGSIKKAMQQNFKSKNIELRYFNLKGINIHVNHRLHGKILLVDSKKYVSGGRNISNGYFSLDKENYIDRDLFVEGESARTAQKSFDQLWNSSLTETVKKASDNELADFENNCLKKDKKYEDLVKSIETEKASTLSKMPEFQCQDVQFTMDDSKFWINYKPIVRNDDVAMTQVEQREPLVANKVTSVKVMEFIQSATESLMMEVWGYIPTAEMNWAIQELRSKKIPVQVVTNLQMDEGEAASRMNQYYVERDHKESQSIYGLSSKGSMNDRWSQTPAEANWIIHSKVFVTNSENVAVTSFNFDPRSFHTNIESGVFVKKCPELAQHILNESNRLIEVYHTDKNCSECQKKIKGSLLQKMTDWFLHEFL